MKRIELVRIICAALLICLLSATAGCMGPKNPAPAEKPPVEKKPAPNQEKDAHRKNKLPREVQLSVPYYMQGARNWCGPASLGMVLKYLGADAELWDIASMENKISEPCDGLLDLARCYKSGATFAQQHEALVKRRYAKRFGLETESRSYWLFTEQSTIRNWIRRNIADGYPVMLMSVSRLHWIVITGYGRGGVTYNDPSGAFDPHCLDCLSGAQMPWSEFFDTLKTFGGKSLQFFVVRKKGGAPMPAAHRDKPRPTIQILPDFWLDRPGAGGEFGTCSTCMFHAADGRIRISFTFVRSAGEKNKYPGARYLFRVESGARKTEHKRGAVIFPSDNLFLKYALYNLEQGKEYVVKIKLFDENKQPIAYMDGGEQSTERMQRVTGGVENIMLLDFQGHGAAQNFIPLKSYRFARSAAPQKITLHAGLYSTAGNPATRHDKIVLSFYLKNPPGN